MQVLAAVIAVFFFCYLLLKKERAAALLLIFLFFLAGFSACFELNNATGESQLKRKAFSGRIVKVSKSGIVLLTSQGRVFVNFNDYQKFLYQASQSVSFFDVNDMKRSKRKSISVAHFESIHKFKKLVRFQQISVKVVKRGKKGALYGTFEISEKSKHKHVADLLARIRVKLKYRLEKWLHVQHASLIYGLLTGDRNDSDPLVSFSFCRLGIGHIMAISGLHLGIIYYALRNMLSRLFSFQEMLISAVTFSILIVYLLFVGLPESALRAIFMALSFELAKILRRKIDLNDSLLFSILLVTTFSPSSILSAGFQFSAASVFGISCLFPLLKRLLMSKKKQTSKFSNVLLLTFSVQLSTTPLQLYYFKNLTLLGSVLNLYAVPALPVFMVCALLLVVFDLLNLKILCHVISCVITASVHLLFFLSSVLSFIPASYLYFSTDHKEFFFQVFHIGIFLLVFFVSRKIVLESGIRKFSLLLLAIVFSLLLLLHLNIFAVFFDCGHGNSFVVTGMFESVLFDTGPPDFSVFEKFMNLKLLPPDAVFLSHYHLDHIGGLLDFIAGFRYLPLKPNIYLPEPASTVEETLAEIFFYTAAKNGYRVWFVKNGMYDNGGIAVEILGREIPNSFSDCNERCSMYIVKVRKFLSKILIFYPSDSPKEHFEKLDAGKFDVMVASHHGSLTGFSKDFYRRLKGIVIIQCGRNRYGFPKKELIQFLKNCRIDFATTSNDGLIIVSSFF